MAQTKRAFDKKVFLIKFILILTLGIALGVSCLFSSQIEAFLHIGKKSSSFSAKEVLKEEDLQIHYLDVGQADCTFIMLPEGTSIMIDAGLSQSADHVIDYVKALGVSQIDHFILTHSDNDHVGGAKKIFDAFEIVNIYRPFQIARTKEGGDYADEKLTEYVEFFGGALSTVKTEVYRKFITAAYSETYTVNGVKKQSNVFVSYDSLTIEPKVEEEVFNFEFFAPLKREAAGEIDFNSTRTYGYPTKNYDNSNNASPVMLLEYKEKSFVFTGDAEEEVESDFLASLTASERERFKNVDVLQAGHHGSSTSNTDAFLELLVPDYFVVSCGEKSKYGHPSDSVVDKVNSLPHTISDYLITTHNSGDIIFGFDASGKLVYAAISGGMGSSVRYWQIALCAFAIFSIVVISVKITPNKKATAKRAVKETERVVKSFKRK